MKTLIGFYSDMSAIYPIRYDIEAVKERIAEARPLERELAEKHSYAKYKAHLDWLELSALHCHMEPAEFDRLSGPYLDGSQGDRRWKARIEFL